MSLNRSITLKYTVSELNSLELSNLFHASENVTWNEKVVIEMTQSCNLNQRIKS